MWWWFEMTRSPKYWIRVTTIEFSQSHPFGRKFPPTKHSLNTLRTHNALPIVTISKFTTVPIGPPLRNTRCITVEWHIFTANQPCSRMYTRCFWKLPLAATILPNPRWKIRTHLFIFSQRFSHHMQYKWKCLSYWPSTFLIFFCFCL